MVLIILEGCILSAAKYGIFDSCGVENIFILLAVYFDIWLCSLKIIQCIK